MKHRVINTVYLRLILISPLYIAPLQGLWHSLINTKRRCDRLFTGAMSSPLGVYEAMWSPLRGDVKIRGDNEVVPPKGLDPINLYFLAILFNSYQTFGYIQLKWKNKQLGIESLDQVLLVTSPHYRLLFLHRLLEAITLPLGDVIAPVKRRSHRLLVFMRLWHRPLPNFIIFIMFK